MRNLEPPFLHAGLKGRALACAVAVQEYEKFYPAAFPKPGVRHRAHSVMRMDETPRAQRMRAA